MQESQSDKHRLFTRRAFLKGAASSAIVLLASCRLLPREERTPLALPPQADNIGSGTEETAMSRRERIVEITPVGSFYRQQFNGVERVEAADWRLTIDGLVDQPLSLSYSDMLALPRAEMMRTLECIGNPVGGNQIGNANWSGFWLDALLTEAGVRPEAVRARFEAADGYNTSVDRSFVDRAGVLMAYEMNGEPLTEEHGFPLRILMPGLYGQKMPKWITRIELIDNDNHRGYWESKGWSEEARVKTNSQIMEPGHIASVPLAEIEVFGVAYAGERQITSVEVGVESGNQLRWRAAELVSGPSDEVWTQFYFLWTPPEDTSYTLLVRATDDAGFVQTERASGILQGAFPDGTDKIHNVVVKAS